jgi:hypothetical protein
MDREIRYWYALVTQERSDQEYNMDSRAAQEIRKLR